MARKSPDDPSSWYGTRQVSWVAPCGHCQSPSTADREAGNPHNCIHELPWFEKLWLCGCECNADWKPVAVIVEKDGTLGQVPENLVIAAREQRPGKAKKKAEQESVETEEKQSSSEETENPE